MSLRNSVPHFLQSLQDEICKSLETNRGLGALIAIFSMLENKAWFGNCLPSPAISSISSRTCAAVTRTGMPIGGVVIALFVVLGGSAVCLCGQLVVLGDFLSRIVHENHYVAAGAVRYNQVLPSGSRFETTSPSLTSSSRNMDATAPYVPLPYSDQSPKASSIWFRPNHRSWFSASASPIAALIRIMPV